MRPGRRRPAASLFHGFLRRIPDDDEGKPGMLEPRHQPGRGFNVALERSCQLLAGHAWLQGRVLRLEIGYRKSPYATRRLVTGTPISRADKFCHRLPKKIPQREKGLQPGDPKSLRHREAPVGIEPTNGGFAVLQSFLSCSNLCEDEGLD